MVVSCMLHPHGKGRTWDNFEHRDYLVQVAVLTYNVSSTGVDDATATAHIQKPMPRLQLEGLQARGMHVWSRHIEVQIMQPYRRVCESFILVLLGHKQVPWTDPQSLDGSIPAVQCHDVGLHKTAAGLQSLQYAPGVLNAKPPKAAHVGSSGEQSLLGNYATAFQGRH